MNVKNNVPKFYMYSFFGLLNFFGPIYILFFQNFGLSLTQIFLFLSVYSITVIILDVPTGIISDYIGRKKTLALAAFFIILEPATIALGTEYWHFIVAYIFLGIGSSLASGTDQSIMYDSLIEMKKKKDYKKTFGTFLMFGQIALITGALAGGYMFVMNPRLPYIMTALAFFIAFIIVASMKEPKRKKPSKKLHKHILSSINTLRENHDLLHVTIFSISIHIIIVMSWFLVQPYYKLIGILPEHFGIMLSVGYLICALTAWKAHVLEKIIGRKIMIIASFLIFVGYLLSSLYVVLYGFVFFYALSVSQGISFTVMNDYINKRIKSHNRATVLSINSFLTNIIMAVAGPLIGFVSDAFSLQTALMLMALAMLVLSILFIPKILKT